MNRLRFHRPALRSRLVWLAFGVLYLTGCDTNPMNGRVRFEISLEEVSGNNQFVGAGGSASAPLVVRAVDQNGTPRSGMVIDWRVTSGDGTLSTASSVTNSSGQAQVVYTSGGSAGDAEVTASLSLTASGSMASRPVDPVAFKITTGAAANSLQIQPHVRTGVSDVS